MEKKMKENRFGAFLKKNKYFILMTVCVLAIVAMITVTALRTAGENENISANGGTQLQDGSGDVNKPDVNNPDQNDNDKEEEKTDGTDVLLFTAPVAGGTYGEGYSNSVVVFSSTLNQWQTHEGVDVMAAAGTEVVAALSGTVCRIESSNLKGTQVWIKHADGIVTVYSLLDDEISVSLNQYVTAGTTIGKISGSSNFESDKGAHLHFEVTKDGKRVDPMNYLPQDNK